MCRTPFRGQTALPLLYHGRVLLPTDSGIVHRSATIHPMLNMLRSSVCSEQKTMSSHHRNNRTYSDRSHKYASRLDIARQYSVIESLAIGLRWYQHPELSDPWLLTTTHRTRCHNCNFHLADSDSRGQQYLDCPCSEMSHISATGFVSDVWAWTHSPCAGSLAHINRVSYLES